MAQQTARVINIGINVDKANRLPKVGEQLAEFLRSVDHDHGPFHVNIDIAVEPNEFGAIGPAQDKPQQVEIIIRHDEEGDEHGAH